jgi:uncharacterized membrane protein (DUF485 family)
MNGYLMYGFLADLVMVLHFGFILLVVFGGLLALRWQRFALLHLPAVLWALFLECKPGTLCPLTPLEQSLRLRAGESAYRGGFIEHYLGPIIYPDMSVHDQYFLGIGLFVLTVVIYWRVYKKWRSLRRRAE